MNGFDLGTWRTPFHSERVTLLAPLLEHHMPKSSLEKVMVMSQKSIRKLKSLIKGRKAVLMADSLNDDIVTLSSVYLI